MIRDLTKSTMSFSWALSLLGLKQALNLFRPNQRSGDLVAPMRDVAVDQLDDSMKGIFRSGDNLQARAVDMAFAWMNPANWFNPNAWMRPFTSSGQQGQDSRQTTGSYGPTGRSGQSGMNGCVQGMTDAAAAMMNPLNWFNPNTWIRPFTACAPQGQTSAGVGQAANGFTQAATGMGQAVSQATAGFTQAVGQATAGLAQAVTGMTGQGANAGRGPGTPAPTSPPVSNESAAAGWGPMPSDS
jgi:hypothetical protein